MRHFFIILIPLLWLAAALVSFFHPGDEYGLFALTTITGVWICMLTRNAGSVHDVLIYILATGCVVMVGLGFLMDLARIRRRTWGVLFIATVSLALVVGILSYPSYERAIAKNGSLTAYIAWASNMGLYLSLLFCFVTKGIAVAVRRMRH
jgi:hypothetical protein